MGVMSLQQAKINKNDEFYTRYEDIAMELPHYKEFLKGKKVYCNCDDPRWSNFWKYLHEHFAEYELKELHASFFPKQNETPFVAVYKGGNDADITCYERQELIGGGSFDSEECIEILKSIDTVITNPPFSKATAFLPLLLDNEKSFILVGDIKWVFLNAFRKPIKEGKVKTGFAKKVIYFIQPDGRLHVFGDKLWYTNLPVDKKLPFIELTKSYYENPSTYPHYENYDAIEVKRVKDIPYDYKGAMGVPISFLTKHNPDQFEIIDAGKRGFYYLLPDGTKKIPFGRTIIKLKQQPSAYK